MQTIKHRPGLRRTDLSQHGRSGLIGRPMQIELQLGGHVIQWLKEAKAELKGGTGTAKMAKLMRSARTLTT
jgi:hypothetical protein